MAAENLTVESADSAGLDAGNVATLTKTPATPATPPVQARPATPARRVPRLQVVTARPVRNSLLAVVLAGYAWMVGGQPPFSNKALFSVLLPGAVLGAIAYGRPPERIPAPESIDLTGFSYWVICLAVLFEWEASAFRDGSPWWHPALTELVNPLIQPHPIKSAAIVVWLLSGWGLVKR